MHTHVLRFRPDVSGLEEAGLALRGLMDEHRVDGKPRYSVELVFDEIGANIIRHGQPNSDVSLIATLDDDEVVLAFEDDGVAFDPRVAAGPTPQASLENTIVGGLGLGLVRKAISRMDYERTPQERNRLTLAIPRR